FFQAEDGIRDRNVTGVQTCALPIYSVMILHMGLRALNRLTRQLHIPISHHRLLSKGEYPSRHQAVSSLKDTGPLFPRLITATIRRFTIDVRERFYLTINRESLNLDR